MSADNDLKAFLKNTEKALRNNTVEDLNKAVLAFLKDKDNNLERVNFVLKIVANHFGISVRILKQSSSRGQVQIARKLTYCLLHYDLGLTTRYIGNRVFGKWHNSVSLGVVYYQKLNLKVKEDKEFLETYILLQEKIKPQNNENIQ